MHKSPIIISGIGRSGTSAVIKSVAEHADVVKPNRIGEAPFVMHFINFLMDYEDNSSAKEYNMANYQLDRGQREAEFSRLLAMMQYGIDITAEEIEGLYWVAKVSLSEEAFLKMQSVFNDVRVIYVMRNGVEVVNSAKSFDGFSHLEFEQLCKRWVNNIKQCHYVHSSDRCAVIKHHDLVRDPHETYERVFNELSMENDSAPGDFIKTNLFNSSFNQSSTLKTTANVFEDRLKCWDDWTGEEQSIFIEVCDELMQEYEFARPYASDTIIVPKHHKAQVLKLADSKPENQGKNYVKDAKLQFEISKKMPLTMFNYFANPSTKHQYFFLENPKVASTSILRKLQQIEFGDQQSAVNDPHERSSSPIPKMSTLDGATQHKILNAPEIFRFAFVRNPYSRLLSAYQSKIKAGLRSKAEVLAVINNVSKEEITDLSQEVSFAQFVDVVCKQEPFDMNPHWNLQSDQILIDHIDYDFIGRFEKLDQDFEYIRSRLFGNEQPGLTQSKNRTGSSASLADFYTGDLAEKVYKKFQCDFENFGYAEDFAQLESTSQSNDSFSKVAHG